jgi:hypothetical protein
LGHSLLWWVECSGACFPRGGRWHILRQCRAYRDALSAAWTLIIGWSVRPVDFSHPISHRTPHYAVGNDGTSCMVSSSKALKFHDETALGDTGRDRLQRFRKPLLYPAELRDQLFDIYCLSALFELSQNRACHQSCRA